ncbi:type II toxin-antitoxin system SpoIISA family toxin [Gracilibacillus sp. S3-1-1]|uniref:Type II toxin-antitoxin system SpoIISA family toxin n=1 Tax=Gracilibacillus pellucidus TaxID=3095368 RepID=A0ACC6M4L3_9BACI|nr:type II toxin-antitoxin system SpoIISA family toxin [Gracilibacillus sp. S3-1-1]MDX8045914.1 type II toxin-antitoxin system SpoIISA family toxin [Gracilibacillus sp. S3-1-1]
MGKTTFVIFVLAGILLSFILFVYIQSWRGFYNKEGNHFRENLYQYRKTLYVLFITSLFILWAMEVVTIDDWQRLAVLAVIIIFIDIFVFSTPTIKSIWKTEFQSYDPLKTYIRENTYMEERQQNKLNYFSQLLQITPLIKADIDQKQLSFPYALDLFLSYYANTFGLRVHLYEAKQKENELNAEPMDEFFKTIQVIKQTHTLDWESMPDNLTMDDSPNAEEKIVETLWNGDIVALDREEKHGKGMAHLCPIFAAENHLFILFIEETNQRVYEMDALFLSNLACLFCFLEEENFVKD